MFCFVILTLIPQEDLVARLTREKAEQLRVLSSQLLLFESRLCRKQKEIEASLSQRESIILRQQRVIRQLQNRLADRSTGTRDSPPCDALDRLDSLGDSDSAVVLEETADDPAPPRCVLLQIDLRSTSVKRHNKHFYILYKIKLRTSESDRKINIFFFFCSLRFQYMCVSDFVCKLSLLFFAGFVLILLT